MVIDLNLGGYMKSIVSKIQGIWFSFVFFLIKIRTSVFGGPKVEVSPSLSSEPSLVGIPVATWQASPVPKVMRGKVTSVTRLMATITWEDGSIEIFGKEDPHFHQLLMAGAQETI